MSNPATYKAAVDMINVNNAELPADQKWVVFPFRAQFIQSFDKTTYGRLLVLVPNVSLPNGTLLDRWIAFAIATPDLNPAPDEKSISMIATIRDPKRPGTNRGFFSDLLRWRDPLTGEIRITSTFELRPSPSKNCYDCHKTAVLPIHPKSAYSFDSGGRLIESSADQNATASSLNSLVSRLRQERFRTSRSGRLRPLSGASWKGKNRRIYIGINKRSAHTQDIVRCRPSKHEVLQLSRISSRV